jgi:hypothetical protein
MRAFLKLALALAIVASTYYAILRIAEHKADALAGGGTFVLDQSHSAEKGALDTLLVQLRVWGERELAAELARLQESGQLWVAPRLAGGRSAVYVRSLGLVSRVYVRRDELVVQSLPFPDLEIPDEARRTFAAIRLAGTLYHEVLHSEGVEDEDAVYDREMAWYRDLGETNADRLEGEEGRWFDWAVESAVASAAAAREKAGVTAVTPGS